MKKFIVFAGMLGLCLAPIGALAQCGMAPGGCMPIGGGVLAEAVTAHATITNVTYSSPITITAGVHYVELRRHQRIIESLDWNKWSLLCSSQVGSCIPAGRYLVLASKIAESFGWLMSNVGA